MKYIAILLLILVSYSPVYGGGFCEFTNQEKEFFEFTERYPFSDKDLSPQSAAKEQKRFKDHQSGKKVEYYIHQNTLNILKGSELQGKMVKAKKDMDSNVPPDQSKWTGNHYNLKYKYLKARKDYCDFQRTHYVVDW